MIRRLGFAVLTVLVCFLAYAAPAHAEEDEELIELPGVDHGDKTAVVEFTASSLFVEDFVAMFEAERDHVSVSPGELACAREGVISSDGQGNLNYGCVAYWRCGGERIDDLYSGEISATDATGVYAEYLTVASTLVSADGPTDPGVEIDRDLLNTDILDGNLGEPDDLFRLPVFYYCRSGAAGPIELFDPTYQVSFGWDTDVESEYDLDRVSTSLIDELFEALETRSPEIAMTPPLAQRVTIVNFPSWFWVDGDLRTLEISGLSDRGTLLMKGRATVDHVEWQLGDTTLECTPAQMLAWDPDNHHPATDRPHCSHVFESLGEWELSATVHYNVEQQLSQRYGLNGTFIEGPWEPHPTQPTFSVTTSEGVLETREIYSINVPIDS